MQGDKIGILLSSGTLLPAQNNISIPNPLDISTGSASSSLIAYFSNNEYYTGSNLLTIFSAYQPNLSMYDSSLVGYWDMKTVASSGTLDVIKDLSSSGNNGACYDSGTIVSCGTPGMGPQFARE